MEHACSCKTTSCSFSSCDKMRRVVAHYRVCKQKESGACVVCKQLLALCCYHAKQCEEATCSVPFCLAIRQNLQRRRFQESASMKRRVAQMGVGTAFNHGHANLSGADDRQTSKGRFEAESASIMTHNTSKGVCFKARDVTAINAYVIAATEISMIPRNSLPLSPSSSSSSLRAY